MLLATIDRVTVAFRAIPLLLVTGTTLMSSIVVLGNLTDPRSNLQFIEHILSMDTTYKSRTLMWRAVRSPLLQRLAFGFVVLCETIVAITGWIGVVALATHLRSPHDQWNAAKFWAIVALGGALAIWFILFEIGGNEWFASWQSPTWNAASDTARINLVTLLGVVLLELAR